MESKLFSAELQKELQGRAPLYSQDGKGVDAICYEHFFIGGIDFYITEGSEEEDNFIFFGVNCIFEMEFGYTSLRELEGITTYAQVRNGEDVLVSVPVKVERDENWTPTKLSEIDKLKSFCEQFNNK